MKAVTTVLMVCIAGLLALGMVMLYSASMSLPQEGTRWLIQQLLWCAVGLAPCLVLAWMDYRKLGRVAWVLLLMAGGLLVLVLIPGAHAVTVKGARRWLSFGGWRFQPSELAKLALIIALAHYGHCYQRQMTSLWRGVIWPWLGVSVVLGLIFVEPDRGTTIFLAAVSAGMLLLAGVRWLHVLPPVFLGAAAMALSLIYDPMRWGRIFSYLNLEETKSGVGWQAWQAMLAFGSGWWTGLGLGNGQQKLGFIPEHKTDFILPVIGEELGLVATLAVVLAFLVVAFCGCFIASRARDTFGFLLASGVTLVICLQAVVNIAVVTSLLPNKGLPLPYISYGGSNLVMMMASLGLLLSVARQAVDRVENVLPFEEEVEIQLCQAS